MLYDCTLMEKKKQNKTKKRIENAEFSGYYFYMKTNIKGDFQICISVPLIHKLFLINHHLKVISKRIVSRLR